MGSTFVLFFFFQVRRLPFWWGQAKRSRSFGMSSKRERTRPRSTRWSTRCTRPCTDWRLFPTGPLSNCLCIYNYHPAPVSSLLLLYVSNK
jgi:hypothetical protein